MAGAKLNPLGLLGRVVGVTSFVCLLPPFGILSSLMPHEEPQIPGAIFFIALILLVCIHLFLFNRAYYALKVSGILGSQGAFDEDLLHRLCFNPRVMEIYPRALPFHDLF